MRLSLEQNRDVRSAMRTDTATLSPLCLPASGMWADAWFVERILPSHIYTRESSNTRVEGSPLAKLVLVRGDQPGISWHRSES